MPNFSLSDTVFEQAAQAYPTPFHLYDEGGIRRTARALNQAFAWCPDFKDYFAGKALPNPAILRILRQEGCGVDCSSATELTLAQACGFHGTEIMFSANAMPPEEFTQARALDAYINLDDITHIDLLRDHGGIPSCVCCRYNPGGDFIFKDHLLVSPETGSLQFSLSSYTSTTIDSSIPLSGIGLASDFLKIPVWDYIPTFRTEISKSSCPPRATSNRTGPSIYSPSTPLTNSDLKFLTRSNLDSC